MLDYIKHYREFGLWPIPLPPRAKQPPPTGWQALRLKTPEQWAACAEKDSNVALLTGIDGFWVIDIDDAELARRVLREHPGLEQETTVVHTHRGIQIWLRSKRPPLSRRLPGLKVDIQGITGAGKARYVVAPLSVHPDGGTYATADGEIRAPMEVEDAEAFLADLLAEAGHTSERLDDEPTPRHGSRHEARALVESLSSPLARLFKEQPGQDWSGALWALERGLCEAGVTEEDAFCICYWAACNKYRRDSRRVKELWQEVQRAFAQGAPPQRGDTDIRQFYRWLRTDAGLAWLVEGLWQDCGIGWLVGLPGSFKTWLALELAVSVASGLPFLGVFPIHRQGPVLIYQLEDPAYRVAARLALIYWAKTGSYIHLSETGTLKEERRWHPLQGKERARWHVSCHLPSPPVWELLIQLRPYGFSFERKDWEKHLEADLIESRSVLTIIDPLYAASDLKPETGFGAGLAMKLAPLRRLREQYKTSFCIAHHTSQGDGGERRPRMRMWGSVLLKAFGETAWALDKQGEEPEPKLAIEHKFAEAPKPLQLRFTIDPEHSIYQVEVKDAAWTQVETLEAIEARNGITPTALIAATGRPARTVYRHIKELKQGNLVVEDKGGRLHTTGGGQGRLPESGDET